MTDVIPAIAQAETLSTRQRLFLRYFTAILVDLTILNLLAEYWEMVELDSFTVSLFAAVLLQVLLKLTLLIEHRISAYFKTKEGARARVLHFLLAWAVLFGSKLVILAAIDFAFGDWLRFGGPFHGVVAFIGVVVAMLVVEEGIVRFYRRLA